MKDVLLRNGNPVKCKVCKQWLNENGKCRCTTSKFKAGAPTSPDAFDFLDGRFNYIRVRIGGPNEERVIGFVNRITTLEAVMLAQAAEEKDPVHKQKLVNYWDARHIIDKLTTADWQGKPALKDAIYIGVRFGSYTNERLKLRCYDHESEALAWVHGERVAPRPSHATLVSRGGASKFDKAVKQRRQYGSNRKTAAELGLKQRAEEGR